MRPHIIGIAGPSCSGKTELARELARRLPGTAIVSLDSYYRAMEDVPLEARRKVNFDHPDAVDWPLLHEHLEEAAAGRTFEEPVYSFADYARTQETKRIEPGRFLIVEGLFVLCRPELRGMLDTKVYVRADSAVCYRRRLARDVAERGRSERSVREQYEGTVRPSAERFIYPSEWYADVVVSGEEPLEETAAAVIRGLRRAAASNAG